MRPTTLPSVPLRRLLHFSLRSHFVNQPEHFFQQKTDSIATSPACPSGHLINPGQQFWRNTDMKIGTEFGVWLHVHSVTHIATVCQVLNNSSHRSPQLSPSFNDARLRRAL